MKQVDINTLSEEQLDSITEKLGKKINNILLKDQEKINKMLLEYGLKIEMGFDIKQI
jgi:hypothetical protein